MSTPPPRVDLPRPRPLDDLAPPIPAHALPEPSSLAVLGQAPEGTPEIAIIAKRTLTLTNEGDAVPADVQVPLSDDYVPHAPLSDGSEGSPMAVPEVLGYRTGTDVVVRAHARPEGPTRRMEVAVRIGQRSHRAVVQGDRQADRANGKIMFSEPAPFEAMPLRYELAYGGQDNVLRLERLGAVQRALSAEDWRISKAFLKDLTDGMPGIAYPRNRFGRGYVVVDRPATLAALRLPNIEFPDDLLTPERLIVGSRENWHLQPLPAGFDFLEPAAFPRTAMVGLPPTALDFDSVAEVRCGQVPPGYCRGNLAMTPPAEVERLVNLEFVRSAAIGLRFGFLGPGEPILLSGMRPDRPEWWVRIPERAPEFALEYENRLLNGTPVLHQLLIDVDLRRMELIWVARHPVHRAPLTDETRELARRVSVNWGDAGPGK